MKPRLLVSLSMGMSVRNLIYSDFLKNAADNFNVTLATSFYNDPVFKDIVKGFPSIELVPLHVPRIRSRLSTLYYKFSYLAFWYLKKPIQVEKHIDRFRSTEPIKFYFYSLISLIYFKLLRRQKIFDLIRDLVFVIDLQKVYGSFDKLFLVSTDQNIDQIYSYSALKFNIPTTILVHSWDNLTSRGFLITNKQKLLVWNERMKYSAIEYHDAKVDDVSVVGVPQYELYKKLLADKSKQHFLEMFNIDHSKKVITFCCSSIRVYPDEEQVLETLFQELQKKYDNNFVLVIRLHPDDSRHKLYQDKFSHFKIRFSRPGNDFKAKFIRHLGRLDEVLEFALLMRFSDVVLNLASTVALDAVCLGTPAIGLAYNSSKVNSWDEAIKHYENSSHYDEILKFNAIPLANSTEVLLDLIDRILRYESFLNEERLKLQKYFSPCSDTSKRIVREILKS